MKRPPIITVVAVALACLLAVSLILTIVQQVRRLNEPPPEPTRICVIITSKEVTSKSGQCP